jgi:hypothetical protein
MLADNFEWNEGGTCASDFMNLIQLRRLGGARQCTSLQIDDQAEQRQ